MILQTEQLIGHIQAGIEEKKGHDIVVADFSNIPEAICQAFVICTGNSPTHLQALTDSVEEFARKGQEVELKPKLLVIDEIEVLNFDEENTTGIISPAEIKEITEMAGAWYSLDGRKLDAKPTKKGLYIHNGKKVVIK